MMTKVVGVAAAAIITLSGLDASFAQSAPEPENGRYALSPVTDGVLRLDTRTGVASICTDKGTGWACYAMPDERAAFDEEIGRLPAKYQSPMVLCYLQGRTHEQAALELGWAKGTVAGCSSLLPKSKSSSRIHSSKPTRTGRLST